MIATSRMSTSTIPADMPRQIAGVIGLVAVLAVNFLANALPLNGKNTGEISDSFPIYFVPAGYAFSIWGLIYLAIGAYTIYQALPSQRTNPVLRRTGWLFVLTCAINSAWIFGWHYEIFPLTIVLMLGLLATLVAIYTRLDLTRPGESLVEKLVIYAPFSLYLGWITVATIPNASDVLYLTGWDGFGISGQMWATILLFVATIIAGAVAIPRRDLFYTLIILWAFAGIAVKQWSEPMVAYTALALAAVLAVAWLAAPLVMRQRKA